MDRPESVIPGRDPLVLGHLIEFYSRPGSKILDVTANRRRMWSGLTGHDVTFLDIDPSMNPDVVGDYEALPFDAESFDVLVYDPPHLPVAGASARSLPQMREDYGLSRSTVSDNIGSKFPLFLKEARRVLRPDGLIFAKLKDYVHNHKYQWTLVEWVNAVQAVEGLSPCDLRIKLDPCGGNLKSGRWQRVHHARVVHTWWAVVRRGKCEPRKEKT